MGKRYFPLISYAIQSKGPVLSGLMLDNGSALLASYLDQAGYRPVIFDFNSVRTIEAISKLGKEGFLRESINELDDFIKSRGIKVIGFKLYTNGFADSTKIANELKKKNPGLVTIAGGPQVDWYGETILDHTDAFDVLSYGYIDGNLVCLADFIHGEGGSLSGKPNLIYRGNGRVRKTQRHDGNINDLVFPLYDEEVYLNINDKIRVPVIEDSRGCSYSKCSFCIHPIIGGKYRERSAERTADEARHNLRHYGFHVFRLSGPSPRAEYVNDLVNHLPEKCRISTFGGPGEYNFPELRDRVLAIFIGLESADERILRLLNKTKRPDEYLSHARAAIGGLKREGIATITSMIVPSPDETEASMERSLQFLQETNPDFAPVLPLFPMPGTQLTRNVLAGNIDGMELEKGYEKNVMVMDIDLLQPPSMWPKVPYRTRIDGKWVENPFAVSQQFTNKLMGMGIYPLSDEIVLMSYLYNNGLSPEQSERRKQCLEFMGLARKYIAEGDAEGTRSMVNKINENQLRGAV